MPPGEPLSPELVMVAPPDEAERARARLEQEALLEQALQASDERAEHVRRAWERLSERQVEQVEQAWEQVAVRAAEQVERHREEIAVRAAELAEREWTELEDVAEPTEALVEDGASTEPVGVEARPVWEELGEPADEPPALSAEDVTEDPPSDSEGDPQSDWEGFLARARAAAPVEPPPGWRIADVPPSRRRSRRKPALLVLSLLAIAVLVGLGWDRGWFRDSQPSTPQSSAPPAQAPGQRTTPASTPAKPEASPKKGTSKPSKKPAVFVPARVWSWPAARGSSRYRVRFFRDGRKVLDQRTTKPRLTLAKDFTFQNGRYRWTVVPITRGGKSLRPIVDSTFVVAGR